MTRSRTFTWIAATIFALIALIHIVRLFTHFRIVIGTHEIPQWVSIVGVVVAAGLSWMLCREARRTTGP